VTAAEAYLAAGGAKRHVSKLVRHFLHTPLSQMTQDVIDGAAAVIYPHIDPATKGATINAYVHTPVSAIMHHVLGDNCPTIRRPKGAGGRPRVVFMWPEDARAIIAEADKIDAEFGLYLRMLIYTGMRKSEGQNLLANDVRPEERAAWLRDSKNEDPRMLKLRLELVGPLFAHLAKHPDRKFLFRWRGNGGIYWLLRRARMAADGLPCQLYWTKGYEEPEHRLRFVTFHVFRHSWATWMRRYGGADVQGLAATGNWRNVRSAERYSHVVSSEEWDRVDSLPSMEQTGKRRGKAAAK
jgi:site-specific recombinase XerD